MDDLKMKLKEKILDELMGNMDDAEGEKLKPKASMSITEIAPGSDDANESDGKKVEEMGGGLPKGDDEMGEDDLKALLQKYLSEC